MLLTAADKIYAGNKPATAVYVGSKKVWPTWKPSAIPGLVTWLDATSYTPGSWPNKASGPAVTIEGTPAMTLGNTLNGKPTVRFTANEGRLRSTWPSNPQNYTLLYLVRWVGWNVGRAFSAQYPPSNFLVGMHTTGKDEMYDNGTWLYGPAGQGWADWNNPPPGPWRMYGADGVNALDSRFFIDGTLVAGVGPGSGGGLQGGWGISGYEASTSETLDIEVAELLLWDHRLTDAERQQAESYLRTKYGITPPAPLYDPDTTAYLSATGLNVSYAPVLDNLVKDLKATGLWPKMKAIYPFIGGTETLHKWNLKDPRDLDAAYRLTFTGGTHSTALGWRPNLTGNTYGNKAYSYLVPAGTLSQDSTHMSMYSLANTAPDDRCEMGAYNWGGGQERFNLIARYNGGVFYYDMAANAGTNAPVPAASGLFVSTRTGSTAQSAYRNGAVVASSAAPSIPLPPVQLCVGGLNGYDQGPSNLCFGFASIGTGLTATDNTNLYNIVQAYQTDLNRQV